MIAVSDSHLFLVWLNADEWNLVIEYTSIHPGNKRLNYSRQLAIPVYSGTGSCLKFDSEIKILQIIETILHEPQMKIVVKSLKLTFDKINLCTKLFNKEKKIQDFENVQTFSFSKLIPHNSFNFDKIPFCTQKVIVKRLKKEVDYVLNFNFEKFLDTDTFKCDFDYIENSPPNILEILYDTIFLCRY